MFSDFLFFLSYEVVVDVVPELRWNPENGYKNMKIIVELGDEIDAKKACERQLRQKYKSLGALKIVTDRGLQVKECITSYLLALLFCN